MWDHGRGLGTDSKIDSWLCGVAPKLSTKSGHSQQENREKIKKFLLIST